MKDAIEITTSLRGPDSIERVAKKLADDIARNKGVEAVTPEEVDDGSSNPDTPGT